MIQVKLLNIKSTILCAVISVMTMVCMPAYSNIVSPKLHVTSGCPVRINVYDASGKITGEIDGFVTDTLKGANGSKIEATKLRLELNGSVTSVSTIRWGHLAKDGVSFKTFPANGREGFYSQDTGSGPIEYTPPYEFDLDATEARPNNDAERFFRFAVETERTDPKDPTKIIKDIYCSKKLSIVKPPVIVVHGINSNSTWEEGFRENFVDLYGFRTFAAVHGGLHKGNGDIRASYKFVRDKVEEAINAFRQGGAKAFPNKKIAITKVDIAAHSYGGLLSRWYIEGHGGDYRGDVRKLLTMGTPHRGATVTNMMLEAFENLVIRYAQTSDTVFAFIGGTMEDVLSSSISGVAWLQENNPNDVVPALRVMSYESSLIQQINSNPFNDNIAYGSIVGTDTTIASGAFGGFNMLAALDPVYDSLNDSTNKSYIPWLRILDGQDNQSDAIVPVWSQRLPAREQFFADRHHVDYQKSDEVKRLISQWLQDPELPKGAEHRRQFLATQIPEKISHDNVFEGSSSSLLGGGIRDEAIIQVQFSSSSLDFTPGLPPTLTDHDGTPAILGSKGGIVTGTATGMVRANSTLNIVEDGIGFDDDTLDGGIAVNIANSNNELVSFSVTGIFGREQDSSARGPDGFAENTFGAQVWEIGYELYGTLGYQAPPSKIDFPGYELLPLSGPGTVNSAGATFTAEGGVHSEVTGGGNQSVRVYIQDDDVLLNDTLIDANFPVTMPSNVFPQILMPYQISTLRLFADGDGNVAGADGSSGDSTAEVLQELDQPFNLIDNPESDTIQVQAVQ